MVTHPLNPYIVLSHTISTIHNPRSLRNREKMVRRAIGPYSINQWSLRNQAGSSIARGRRLNRRHRGPCSIAGPSYPYAIARRVGRVCVERISWNLERAERTTAVFFLSVFFFFSSCSCLRALLTAETAPLRYY